MRFSEREGLRAAKQTIQTHEIDDALRNSLWNILDLLVWSTRNYLHISGSYGGSIGEIDIFSRSLWSNFLKLPADERPLKGKEILSEIRKFYFKADWCEVYDFIEFVVIFYRNNRNLPERINAILKRELSGYRIIGHSFVPVTSQSEVESVEKALKSPFSGSAKHINQALIYLSSKPSPDYRNSIKESISAVESACNEITGQKKATLGLALKTLASRNYIHPALVSAFEKLYGYTSDEGGIRHALLDESKVSADDANFSW